jgi:hypothetical protein
MGVTSVLPQNACSRSKPDFSRLMGGRAIPCVIAAPRATFVQKLSAIFGVTRTNSTGGMSAT